MKVRIELDPSMDEPEILIRAPRLTQELAQLQESILKKKLVPLAFYKNRSEYFLDLANILFFETDGEKIFGHTKDEAYEVKNSTNWKSCFRLPFVGFPNRRLLMLSRFILWRSLFQGPAR